MDLRLFKSKVPALAPGIQDRLDALTALLGAWVAFDEAWPSTRQNAVVELWSRSFVEMRSTVRATVVPHAITIRLVYCSRGFVPGEVIKASIDRDTCDLLSAFPDTNAGYTTIANPAGWDVRLTPQGERLQQTLRTKGITTEVLRDISRNHVPGDFNCVERTIESMPPPATAVAIASAAATIGDIHVHPVVNVQVVMPSSEAKSQGTPQAAEEAAAASDAPVKKRMPGAETDQRVNAAIAYKMQNPDWSDKKCATEAGVAVSTLNGRRDWRHWRDKINRARSQGTVSKVADEYDRSNGAVSE